MKTPTSHTKQHGFFEIGLGLAILALFGGATAIAIEASKPDEQEKQYVACSEYTTEYIDSGLHCE